MSEEPVGHPQRSTSPMQAPAFHTFPFFKTLFRTTRITRLNILGLWYRGTSLIRNTHPPVITTGP
jgi:hypothetical protein